MSTPIQENTRYRRLRLAGRWFVLVAAVGLGGPWTAESLTSVPLPSLSPHVAIGSALAVRTVGVLTLLAVPVAVLVLIMPRWFCRHACPTGLLQELIERFRPGTVPRWQRVPSVGKYLVLLTLGGAAFGYPIFLWLDPLAIFSSFLAAWRQPLTLAALTAGLGLPALLLLDLLLPRLWCKRLCPLGATQDLLALPGQRMRKASRCKTPEPPTATPPRHFGLARRGFLGLCLGAGGALVIRQTRGQTSSPLRPPGALTEDRFTGVCIRCGNCAQACPSRIIQPDLGRHGVAGLFTPELHFEADYCREQCRRCLQVCPSGALAPLTLAEKCRHVIGTARVDLDRCFLAAGKECTVCIRRCPFEALTIQTDNDGFSTQPAVDAGKCNGCGACETACPTRPDRAIRVVARNACK